MKFTRTIAVLAAVGVAVTVALTGCSGTSSSGSKVVAFVPGYLGNGFYNSLYDGVKSQAKKYGWTATQQGSNKSFSASAQTPYVRAVCARQPAVLVIAPTDAQAMRAPIQDCINAGIKVVIVDTTLTNSQGVVTSIQSGNEQGGELAADFIGKKLKGQGTVSIHTGSPQANTQALRVKGAQSVFNSKYPNLKQLEVIQDTEVNAAQTSTASSLIGHPELAAVFDATGSCVGEQKAVEAAGKNVTIVCFDSSPSQNDLLKAGKVAAMVVQPAFQEGTIAVQSAYNVINGKASSVKKNIQLKDVMITADDANKPEFQKYFYNG
jgi:ribose transport system substrate-binding protein